MLLCLVYLYIVVLFVDQSVCSLQEVPSKLRLWMIRVDSINVDDLMILNFLKDLFVGILTQKMNLKLE